MWYVYYVHAVHNICAIVCILLMTKIFGIPSHLQFLLILLPSAMCHTMNLIRIGISFSNVICQSDFVLNWMLTQPDHYSRYWQFNLLFIGYWNVYGILMYLFFLIVVASWSTRLHSSATIYTNIDVLAFFSVCIHLNNSSMNFHCCMVDSNGHFVFGLAMAEYVYLVLSLRCNRTYWKTYKFKINFHRISHALECSTHHSQPKELKKDQCVIFCRLYGIQTIIANLSQLDSTRRLINWLWPKTF